MKALTSISPKHQNNQNLAIESWLNIGFDVISFNNSQEIELLSKLYQKVEFIEASKTMESLFKKPLPCVNVFLDYIIDSTESCMIINSDIELKQDFELYKRIEGAMQNSLILGHRFNYIDDKTRSSLHDVGFDVFFINKDIATIYKDSDFAIGQCHYDYWIPYVAIMNKIPVKIVGNKFAYHKKHSATQYQNGDWMKTAIHLNEIEGLNYQNNERDLWRMNNSVFRTIKDYAKVELI